MNVLNPIWAILGVAPFFALIEPSSGKISPELYDYMVQDVCLDDQDLVTADDPLICKKRRNIRVGEQLPYLLTDSDLSNNMTYQAMASFPVHGTDGTIKILYPKLNQGPFSSKFRMTGFSDSRDGYDLADISHTRFASFIRTSDGGCFDQIWSSTGQIDVPAKRAGGWLLFPYKTPPSQWGKSESERIRTYKVQLTKGKTACKNGSSLGVTFWTRPAGFKFQTGKTLTAITSSHFASHSLSKANNALERFHFTREYGFTRWEAWIPQKRCVKERGKLAVECFPERSSYPISLAGRCNAHNAGITGVSGLDRWGKQDWVRVDCRDLTNHIALEQPVTMMTGDMATTNGIRDIDMPKTIRAISNQVESPDG
jgi:hypothetical protein